MGTQLILPKEGVEPPIFGPCLLWPNDWKDQDGTWHGGGPRSRPHCCRWGASSPPLPPKRGRAPNSRPISIVPNRWMHQDATWYGGRPLPRRYCVRSPSNTMSPRLRPTCVPSGILIHTAVWFGSAPFLGGGAGSPSTTMC